MLFFIYCEIFLSTAEYYAHYPDNVRVGLDIPYKSKELASREGNYKKLKKRESSEL